MRSMKLSKETKKLFKLRRRFSPRYVLLPLLGLLLLVSFLIYDNNRVRLERVSFSMPTLPKDAEGYTILHLSDIHEFSFGEGGVRLHELLEGQKISVAVISGGLTDENGEGTGFLQALTYLQAQGVPCYYVLGGDDPAYMDFQQDGSYARCTLYERAEALGGEYLETPVDLLDGETGLWLMPASSLLLDTDSALRSLNALEQTYLNDDKAVQDTGLGLDALLESIESKREVIEKFRSQMELHSQNDLNIFLTHMPAMPKQYQSSATSAIFRDADLILSGYNHGGWRIPLLGCFYVDNEQFSRGGWLPGNALISGLSDQSGWNQYVSPGLGSGSGQWHSFRFFSTPTITLIELTKSLVQ